MGTPTAILGAAGVAILLLIGAIIADRLLERRLERRSRAPEAGARGADAADAFIGLLDRAGEMVRKAMDSPGKGGQGQDRPPDL